MGKKVREISISEQLSLYQTIITPENDLSEPLAQVKVRLCPFASGLLAGERQGAARRGQQRFGEHLPSKSAPCNLFTLAWLHAPEKSTDHKGFKPALSRYKNNNSITCMFFMYVPEFNEQLLLRLVLLAYKVSMPLLHHKEKSDI